MTALSFKTVSATEGLRLLGVDPDRAHRRISVMVSRGPIRVKHYAAWYRLRDRQLLYRWGTLNVARVTYIDGAFSHVVFDHVEVAS